MSYSSFLKNTVSLNTTGIFEKNDNVAVYQNMSQIVGFKFLDPNRIWIFKLLLLRIWTEPEPDDSKYL